MSSIEHEVKHLKRAVKKQNEFLERIAESLEQHVELQDELNELLYQRQ